MRLISPDPTFVVVVYTKWKNITDDFMAKIKIIMAKKAIIEVYYQKSIFIAFMEKTQRTAG